MTAGWPRAAASLAEGPVGAGVVVSELVAVAPGGRITPGTPGLWADGHAGPWAALARRWPGTARPWPCGSATPGAAAPPGPAATGSTGPCPAAGRCCRLGHPLHPGEPGPGGHGLRRHGTGRRRARGRCPAGRRRRGAGAAVRPGPRLPARRVPVAAGQPATTGSAGRWRAGCALQVVDAVRAAWPADRPLWAAVAVTDWRPAAWSRTRPSTPPGPWPTTAVTCSR